MHMRCSYQLPVVLITSNNAEGRCSRWDYTVPWKEHKDTVTNYTQQESELFARLVDLLHNTSVTTITASEFRLKSNQS